MIKTLTHQAGTESQILIQQNVLIKLTIKFNAYIDCPGLELEPGILTLYPNYINNNNNNNNNNP